MMNVYLVNNMIKLKDTTGHDWTKAYYLEAVFNHVFNEQYEYGCKVDLDLMQQLETDIANLIESLEVQIYESIPSKLLWKVTGGTAIKMNTANGAYSKRFLSFAEKAELSLDQVAGDVTPVEFEMLNLESPKQRNECLLKMGWVPLEFNYKETVDGRPLYDETGNKVILSAKLTEESVTCLPTGQLMLRYLVYSHKLKLVKGLRKLVRPDGTIGAGGISCGTNCFTIDTLINTQRGVVKFSDLEVTDEVVTHEGVLKPVVEIFNNGTKPVLKIVTEKGLSIRVTENHPILIDGNWKVASEVVEGDNVLVYSSVERWALIKDSRYSISSWGRVRSETDDKLLRLQVGDSGHLNVTLETSPRNTYRVHRLVAQYFLEGFDPSLHILHKNGMAFDNRVENLKIGNDKDNMVDTLLHGRLTTGRRRLSEDQITYIKNSSKTGVDLAKELNISRGMICCIRRGSRYKTYEFKAPKVDFFADKVSTITSEGLQPTFGFEVRDHHSHITNGIVTHNTARAVHRGVVNIPRVGDDFGTELRSLFIAREGKVILGADLSALENRLAGHFTWDFDNGEYAKRLMEEDPHTNTVNLFSGIGLPIDRNTAKTCVPLTAKALTRRGWKFYNELIIGEDVLAYDSITRTKKWTPLLDVTVIKDKEVLTFEDNSWKFEATADHRWFVNQRKRSSTLKSFARPYIQEEVRTTSELNSESNLIINAPMDATEDLIPSSNLLANKKYGTDWTQKILNMSQKERLAFLEGFMIADGYEVGNSWKWSQNDNEFCEAALTASYLVHSGAINVSLKKNKDKVMKTALLNKKSHTTFQHKGFVKTGKICDVWCPTTAFGSWVMRQEDCITITGNCNYALGYGARPEKLQSVLKCTVPLAKQAFDLWWADRQVMLKLQEQLLSALDGRGQLVSKFRLAEGAYILGIDGRKLFVRSTHSLVNSLIQNAGSLINKFITSYIYAQIEKRSLDAHFILQFHDEVQIELVESDIPAMRELIIDATNACNKYYNLRVPMLLDVKVGKNWANTH